MVTPESSTDHEPPPPAWVDAVEVVGNLGNTVLNGLRGDLTDRRARWAVGLVTLAGTAGTALLRHRYPPTSADQRLVAAAMKDARSRGESAIAELRHDPEFHAAQTRLNRRFAQLMITGVSLAVAHRLLLAELKRRNVRRPHLVAGIALGTAQAAYRTSLLVTDHRRRADGQP